MGTDLRKDDVVSKDQVLGMLLFFLVVSQGTLWVWHVNHIMDGHPHAVIEKLGGRLQHTENDVKDIQSELRDFRQEHRTAHEDSFKDLRFRKNP